MVQPKISRKFRNFEAKILKMFVTIGIILLALSDYDDRGNLNKGQTFVYRISGNL